MQDYLVIWSLTENPNQELGEIKEVFGVLEYTANQERSIDHPIKYNGFLSDSNLTFILNHGCPTEFYKLFKGKFNFPRVTPSWINILISRINNPNQFEEKFNYLKERYNAHLNIEKYSF